MKFLPCAGAVLTAAVLSACGSKEDAASNGGAATTNPSVTSAGGSSAGPTAAVSAGGAASSMTAVSSVAGPATGVGGAATTMGNATTTMAATTTDGVSTTSMGGGASTTTATTTGGGGTGSTLTGGASGAFVCPIGTFGNPLEGMGAVEEIQPGAEVNFFAFLEGPVWVGSLGTLFFSDHSSPRRIIKLVPPSTTPEVWSSDSNGSNGLAIDNDDMLIVSEEGISGDTGRIVRIDPGTGDPTNAANKEVLKDGLSQGGPNDIIYRSDGNIYFSNPNQGFFRLAPDGELTGPITEVSGANGVVLSPDENTLYVGSVQQSTITQFPLDPMGAVGSGTPFASSANPTFDGMAVDCGGNVYVGTGNGVDVFDSTGESLGTIPSGEAANVTFGGAERRTLYIASRSLLKAVTLAVPGLPD